MRINTRTSVGVCRRFQLYLSETYCPLGKFLYNNYKQALDIIQDYGPDVQAMLSRLNINEDDVVGWIQKESVFLGNLQEEPEERALECEYVEKLIAREEVEYVVVSLAFFDCPSLKF